MRLVFLDIDGVLNSHAYTASLAAEERGGVIGIDRSAVVRLNRLLKEADASVVVSSTWRHNRGRVQLQAVLDEHGFTGHVLGRTPRWLRRAPGGLYAAEERGNEIQAWLDAAPDYDIDVVSFVILDDDSDMAHLADRLIKTSFDDGLLDSHVDRAVTMLRAPMPLVVLASQVVTPRFTP